MTGHEEAPAGELTEQERAAQLWARGGRVMQLLEDLRSGCGREAALDALTAALVTCGALNSEFMKVDGRYDKDTSRMTFMLAKFIERFEEHTACTDDHSTAEN